MSSGDGDVQPEEEKMRWNLFQILEGVSYGRNETKGWQSREADFSSTITSIGQRSGHLARW